MEEKIFGILLDNINKKKIKLNNNLSLSDARIQIKKVINQKFEFLDNEKYAIETNLENDLKISDLKTDDKIYLKSINQNNEIQEININIKKENKPLPDAIFLKNEKNFKIYQYPNIEFTLNEKATEKTILIVGQTGSGKTSFINAFVNYLMEIELYDDFRYTLIIEKEKIKTESQTKGIHIYNIRSRKMLLRIVDTQGFGDTNGIEEDEKITLAIKDSFMKELNSINAILFVVKSSDTRLTVHQKYIFNSIINLFGKDIQNNFLALITFYPGTGIPSGVKTLEESDFKDVIPYIQKPWYLCFDNTIIYGDPDDEVNQLLYKKLNNNYKILCERISSLNRNSLTQSKKNLDIREQIEMKGKAL